MDIYLVGGAVRDRQLGLPMRERDWVVVGGTPAEMESRGFRKVGKSFPVYLHPETGEEYALARTETKTGPGYHGFSVNAGADVTLDQDLGRRDLTINAMAQDERGNIIDPFGGLADLRSGILRHVSDAFREDPLRILRVARFAARFSPLGFEVAGDTLKLMRSMTAAGEAGALVPQRVWQEVAKALAEPRPDVFFSTLRSCGALAVIFPEVEAMFGVPQPEKWHPEIDTGIHILMVLRLAAQLGAGPEVCFAALCHDLGKGTTPPEDWPRHRGHEESGVDLIIALCERLGVPNRYRELAIQVARHHTLCHRADELRPDTILRLMEQVDAFRRPERFEQFLLACESDARGRKGLEQNPYPQAALLRAAFAAASQVSAAALKARGLEGQALGEGLREARVAEIRATIAESRKSHDDDSG